MLQYYVHMKWRGDNDGHETNSFNTSWKSGGKRPKQSGYKQPMEMGNHKKKSTLTFLNKLTIQNIQQQLTLLIHTTQSNTQEVTKHWWVYQNTHL